MKYPRISVSLPVIIIFLIFSYRAPLAQEINISGLRLSHPLNHFPEKRTPLSYSQFPETLNVICLRVQFASDSNPQTTGDGRFDITNSYPDSVDAPPHDSIYFINHLEFLKNYYYRSSKGKLIIKYQLAGGVRNLAKEMKEYSPGRNENLLRMGSLFFEAWASADSVIDFSGVDPSKTAFVIFHAGAGRDIDLTSQGIFQGEQDIPSIYLGLNSLKSIYGDTTRGYYTREGVVIPGSAIIPEQEYRVISTSFGSFFLELGMNGILVASIGSHIGLPDLFDTKTGKTAIGRFGLMDGQSIFSFSGVFPPEPSAWEKQYLGWITPVTVNNDGIYTTRAASIDQNGNSSVHKILISGKEYFLAENRNRDAKKDGQTVYYRVGNDTNVQSVNFNSDQDGFQNGDVWKLRGSITDVDELDWSLPGLKNDTADFQGGILVWHIDENVIDANLSSNTINTDINHRGVDIEEAKGSQDIGVEISTPFGVFISDGFFVDFWYNGDHYVPAAVYRNEFTPSSIPNSKSYLNINSRVCLSGFSTIDSSMTFTFQRCGNVANVNTFPRFVGLDPGSNPQPIGLDFNGNGFDEIFINIKDSLYGFRDNGNPIRVDAPNGYLTDSASNYTVGLLNYSISGNNKFIVGIYKNSFTLISFNIDSATSEPAVLRFNTNAVLSTPHLINRLQSPPFKNYIYAGTADGRIAKLDIDSLIIRYDSVSGRPIKSLAEDYNGVLPAVYDFIDDTQKFFANSIIYTGQPPIEPFGNKVTVGTDNRIRRASFSGDTVISNNLGLVNVFSSPVIADINKDGNQEIIFTADDKVYAINKFGFVIDNFPFSVTGLSRISSGCSVADLNGDGVFEVIFGTSDGRVYAYGTDGKVLDGFPLLAGKEVRSTPAVLNQGGKFGLAVYSLDGYLYAWKTVWDYDSSRVIWRNFLADGRHSNSNFNVFTASVTGPCLPQDRVYNWPNPVYGNSTNVRYFLNGSAKSVKVKIMDLSGELVTTLTGPANSGFDNEVSWDVSSVQSGIYIAVVELESGDCDEVASIKIAVVK